VKRNQGDEEICQEFSKSGEKSETRDKERENYVTENGILLDPCISFTTKSLR
jgi:hypothetical protein